MLLELAGTFVATFVARADRRDTIARLHALHAVALNVLVGLNGPVGLDRLARLNRLVVLDVDGLARLDSLDVFAALDSLHALRTFAELRAGLRPAQGLDALKVSRADIAELLLKIRILELRIAMHCVELPGLRGAGSDSDPVKFAVEGGIGLDRGEAGMSPVVAVP